MKRIRIAAVMIALVALALVSQVAAEDITLNNPNAALIGAGTGGSNNFGKVTISLSGTTMSVKFTMDTGYYIKTNTFGAGSVGFQVTGSGFGISGLTGKDSGGNTVNLAATLSSSTVSVPGATGSYQVLVDLGVPPGCGGTCAVIPGLSTLSFNVSGVTSLDPKNFFAHVVVGNGPLTGFVGTGGGNNVPEPASLFLMGSGLIGFSRVVRKRFKK